jgi:restriction system protein
MARRRKKVSIPVRPLVGFGALAILIGISITNPWSPVSIIFVLVLICLAGLWLFNLSNKLGFKVEQKRHFKRVSHVKSLPQMTFLTPTDFEHYVAMLFTKLGHTATVTKPSGDGGIDIILRNGNETAAVQVKRFTKGKVGRPDVQKLVGASQSFDLRIFVTNVGFSSEAREYADQHKVKLIDGNVLVAMARQLLGEDYIQKSLQYSILERK